MLIAQQGLMIGFWAFTEISRNYIQKLSYRAAREEIICQRLKNETCGTLSWVLLAVEISRFVAAMTIQTHGRRRR